MEKRIPKEVKAIADQECCNQIDYIGTIIVDAISHEVYCISEIDENGLPVPVGLPVLILWNGFKVDDVVTDSRSFEILSQIDNQL